MKSLSTLLFISTFFSITGFSQARLEGVVVDHITKQPLEFSTISLYRLQDSTFVLGTIADVRGRFLITNLTQGNYYLTIKFLGYETRGVATQVIGNGQPVNVGVIGLEIAPALLHDVEVRAEKIKVDHQIDKQVYAASQFQSAQGGTAVDVLKNLPAVSVNSEGEITLRGASSFIVLIDGKPTQSDPALILNQLPANTIENVEVITTPSSKYDPDGKGGVINITTKKGTTDGYYILFNAQGGLPSVQDYGNEEKPVRFGADVTTNYRKNKWNLSLSANYKREDIAGYRDGEASTYTNATYTTLPSRGERSYRSFSYSIKGSANYQFDKSNTIEIGFYGGKRSQFRKADIVYDQNRIDLISGDVISSLRYFNKNFRERKGDVAVTSIEFNHAFQNEGTVNLSALYEKTILGGPTENKDVNPEDQSQVYNQAINEERNPLDGIRLKADYRLPLGGKGKLETGYQYRYLLHKGEFTYNQLNVQTDEWFVRPDLSNGVTLTRNIHSIYSQYADETGTLSYSAGLRLEYVDRTLTDESNSLPYKFERLNLFPSATILYKLENGYKLKAGYSKRIVHTTSNMMNPFPARRHSEVLETGDPNLLPEYVDVADVGVVKDFGNNSAFINGYARNTKNVINRVNAIYNDSILVRTFTNAGRASAYGVEGGVDLKPLKWFSIFAGGTIYYYGIKGSVYNTSVDAYSINYSFNTNATVKLFSSLSLQLTLNYTSKSVTAQGEDSRFVIPTATLKKTLWKGEGSVSLQWQNIDAGLLESNEQRLTTRGEDFYSSTNYIQEVDIFRVSFSYQLNRLAKKLKFTESEFGEKEF